MFATCDARVRAGGCAAKWAFHEGHAQGVLDPSDVRERPARPAGAAGHKHDALTRLGIRQACCVLDLNLLTLYSVHRPYVVLSYTLIALSFDHRTKLKGQTQSILIIFDFIYVSIHAPWTMRDAI